MRPYLSRTDYIFLVALVMLEEELNGFEQNMVRVLMTHEVLAGDLWIDELFLSSDGSIIHLKVDYEKKF